MTDLDTTQWTLGILSALLVGFSKTGVAGLGILAIPLMAMVFPARESTGVLLPMLVIGDFAAVGYYRRHAVWRDLLRLLPWVMGGLAVGYYLLRILDDAQMRPLLGGLILGLLVLHVMRRRLGDWMEHKLPHTWWFAAIIGVFAGAATMLANAAGPIMIMYFLAKELPKREFMGTGAWFYFIVNLLKLPFSAGLGLITAASLTFDAMMAPLILLGALVGIFVLAKMPQQVFDKVVLAIAVVASLRLISPWP